MCWKCCGEQSEWVMHTIVNLGHCPCKDVYVFSLCKDECTLQRARGWVSWGPILGCMCMLHDLWNQFLNVIKVWKMDDCFDHTK